MAAALVTLLRTFWGLCVFRLKPQDLPASGLLLALTSAVNPLVSVFINRLSMPFKPAIVDALLEFVVVAGVTTLLLYGLARKARIGQTLTALMGSGALLGLIVLAVWTLFPALPPSLRVGILLWNLSVVGNILRHAFDTGFVVAFFIAVSYALLFGLLRMNVHTPGV